MKKIENVTQLHAEIVRLKVKVKDQEKDLRKVVLVISENLKPVNLLVNSLSSFTGVKMTGNEFMKDGMAIGLSLLVQRFILKTERKIEHKVYDFIDSLLDKVKSFMEKFTSPEAKRSERKQDELSQEE